MGTESFPGVKRPGRDADPSPLSSTEVKKSRAIPPLSLRAFVVYEMVKPTKLNLNVLERLSKVLQISDFMEFPQVEAELFHANERTDRRVEAHSCFSQFCQST